MSRPLALITGASAGIGLAFADQLARAGHDLIAVARRRDRLEALAARLHAEHGARVEVLVADLATPAGVDAVAARVAAAPLELVVNNAGFGAYRPFVQLEPATADELLSIHVRATVQITRAALPAMVARKQGGIINVASLLAYSGSVQGSMLPARAIYAATKAFMVTFTQILANELGDTGVRASVCLPGLVATEFHEVQGMDLSKLPRMAPADVARAALAGWRAGEVIVVPALEDPAALKAIDDAQTAVLGLARATAPATRYR